MNETNEFRGERLKVKWLYVLILFFTLFLLIAAPATRKTVKEGKDYSDKESVALYLYTYKKLPGNYILTRRNLMEKQTVNNRETENIIIGNMIIRRKLKHMRKTTVYRT